MPGLGQGRKGVSFLRTQEGKPVMFQTIFKLNTHVLKLLKRRKRTASSPSQPLLRTPGREANREGQLGENFGARRLMDTAGTQCKGKRSDFVEEIPGNSGSGEPGLRGSHCLARGLHCSETVRGRTKSEAGKAGGGS